MGDLKRIGIVTGLRIERQILVRRRRSWGERMPLLVCAGMGPDASGEASEQLVQEGASGLASFGLSGALDPTLAAGAVILPTEVCTPDGRRYACEAHWRESLMRLLAGRLPAAAGVLLTAADIVASPREKVILRKDSGAIAVDMESAGVAAAAALHRMPFLAVRVILDTAGQRIPPAARLAIDPAGAVRIGTLLGSLLRDPGQIGDLAALARQSAAALRTLTGVCDLAGPRLGLGG